MAEESARSSVTISQNAKGEAAVVVKVYDRPLGDGEIDTPASLAAAMHEIAELAVRTLVRTKAELAWAGQDLAGSGQGRASEEWVEYQERHPGNVLTEGANDATGGEAGAAEPGSDAVRGSPRPAADPHGGRGHVPGV